MEKHFDLLIIGGGPAAITIAKILKNKMKIGIIRPEDHSMIYCAMPYAIEGLLPVEKTLKKDIIVTETGAELIRDKVTKVDFGQKQVSTEKGKEFSYNKLVIATGATPLTPPIPGIDLKGVMTFKTENDLRRIMQFAENGLKKAVIVGAGAIGIELAQALNTREIETHLIDMADHILPNMTDYEMIEEAQEDLIKSGINLHLKSRVIKLEGDEFAEHVTLDNNQIIHLTDADNCSTGDESAVKSLIVFAVGMKPTIDIFSDTALEIGKDGIIVNPKMETNIPDVYAVGDCCQFTSGITKDILSGKLATNAVPMGRVLAKNLAGGEESYPGFYNGAATKVEEFFIGSTGFTESKAAKNFDIIVGYSEFTTAFPIMPFARKVKMKLIADRSTETLVGGQVVSGAPAADKVDQITMAIQYKIKLRDLVNFSYSSQPYQSFYPAHNLIVKAVEEILKQI